METDNSDMYYEILDLIEKLDEHELHDVIINCEDICMMKFNHHLQDDSDWRRKRLDKNFRVNNE